MYFCFTRKMERKESCRVAWSLMKKRKTLVGWGSCREGGVSPANGAAVKQLCQWQGTQLPRPGYKTVWLSLTAHTVCCETQKKSESPRVFTHTHSWLRWFTENWGSVDGLISRWRHETQLLNKHGEYYSCSTTFDLKIKISKLLL